MAWRVRKEDVGFFLGDLWKDLRGFAVSTADEFGKDCFADADAAVEAAVLGELERTLPQNAVPKVLRVEGSVVYMERVWGIRLFDLIRHLRGAEADGHPAAAEARSILIHSASERLREIQLALAGMAQSNGILRDATPYPLELKVRNLLEFFVRILDLSVEPPSWIEELSSFQEEWNTYATVPFRDATTKNMLARVIPVAEVDDAGDDIESWQRAQVAVLLERGGAYWASVALTDINFSSVVNLSSPEDDPVSLFGHEWTAGTVELSAERLILDPSLGAPNPRRAALTLLVRYLRFGGRKLAYRLVNSQGFSVRFAFDDPLYYFESVRAHCHALDPGFDEAAPGLLGLMEDIAHAIRSASPQDRQLMQIDHVRRFGFAADYWQQSPLEGGRDE